MMTRKTIIKRAQALTEVCAALLEDGLQKAPISLQQLSKLKLHTYDRRLTAESLVDEIEARLMTQLRESLQQKGKLTVDGLKAAVASHDDYLKAVKTANRAKSLDAFVGDCIADVNQKLSAMKAQVSLADIEARAAIDPKPMKGRR